MGLLADAGRAVEQTANDFHDDAEDARRKIDDAAAEAKRKADEAAAEAKRIADEAAAAAQQQVDAIAAEAARQANRVATEARRIADAAFSDARRKIDEVNQTFRNTVGDIRSEIDRSARKARNQISGFIATGTTLPDVFSWLHAHPSITFQIMWQTTAGLSLPYPLWNPDMKRDLERAFRKAWDSDSIMTTDPVTNWKSLADDEPVVQILDHADAWNMFLAYIAQSLAVEIGNRVQWSLIGYSAGALTQLFHSSQMFNWNVKERGYEITAMHGNALPCSPATGSSFLFDGIIDSSNRPATIANLVDWCRSNLIHFTGKLEAAGAVDQWQYRGLPPVLNMLAGTPMSSRPSDGIQHRTAGCRGTVGFLRSILRTVNIPVQLVTHAGHAQPYFVEDGLYLSHGDDPYDQFTTAIPPMPISELLIGQKQFDEWFGRGVKESAQAKNIGRRTIDLSIQYLPNELLRTYCRDRAAGKTHDTGEVQGIFSGLHDVAELEQFSLWTRMDDKIASFGGCAAVP